MVVFPLSPQQLHGNMAKTDTSCYFTYKTISVYKQQIEEGTLPRWFGSLSTCTKMVSSSLKIKKKSMVTDYSKGMMGQEIPNK